MYPTPKASTRQRTRLVSNYLETSPEAQQKNVNFLNSVNNPTASQQQTKKADGNVKPDTKTFLSPDIVNIIDNHRAAKWGRSVPSPRVNSNVHRNLKVDESDTDTESVTSLYSNSDFGKFESETVGESDFEVKPEVHDSINNLKKDIDAMTKNYVQKVKTQVEEAMCNMTINDRTRANESGCGDKKPRYDEINTLRTLENEKKECYRKIAGLLHRMKNIDNVTDEIWKNHLLNKR